MERSELDANVHLSRGYAVGIQATVRVAVSIEVPGKHVRVMMGVSGICG